MVLKAAPFIGDQRGVLLKALCKLIFVVRSRDKEFEALLLGRWLGGCRLKLLQVARIFRDRDPCREPDCGFRLKPL